MTEEQREWMRARDVLICRCYAHGGSITECAAAFGLGRLRVRQILKAARVWQPPRASRTAHLGVKLRPQTKAALPTLAKRAGVTVSKLVSNHLDQLVKEEG